MPDTQDMDEVPLAGGEAWAESPSPSQPVPGGLHPESLDAEAKDTEAKDRVRLRKRHWSMLRITAVIFVLACLLQIRPDHRVQFRWGPPIPVPETCGSKILFGTECPGCGLTRCFISLSRGDLWAAWKWNRVGCLLALAVAAQIPYRLWSLRQLDRNVVPDLTWPIWFGRLLIFLLIGNWVLKVSGI